MKGFFFRRRQPQLTNFAGTKLGEVIQTNESYEDTLWGISEEGIFRVIPHQIICIVI
jgi:hypothetical protein